MTAEPPKVPSSRPSPKGDADRNLLFGILALQMDFVNRDALIAAMHAWVLQKSTPLGEILVQHGGLAANRRTILEALVDEHVTQHQADPQQSIAALRLPPGLQRDLEEFADPDVNATLGHLARTPSTPLSGATTLPPLEGEGHSDERFSILRRHAWGGLGEVYVAQDIELHREVALKRLHERHADSSDSEKIDDATGCRTTAEMWERLNRADGDSLYNAGCFGAVTAAVVRAADKSASAGKKADADADRAMVCLKRAVAAGYTDVANMKRDTDLDSLRDRDDFKKLVADLERKSGDKAK